MEELAETTSGTEQVSTDQNLLAVTKQTSGVMVFRILGLVIGLGSNVVFARMLGPRLLGVFVQGSTTILLLSLLASSGMGHTFVRYIPVRLSRGDRAGAAGVFRLGMWIILATSTALGAVSYALRNVIAGPIFKEPLMLEVMPFVAVGVAGASFQLVLGLVLRALRKTAQESLCLEVVNKTAKLAVFAAMAAIGSRLIGISAAFVAAEFIAAGTMVFLIHRQAPFLFSGPSEMPVGYRELVSFSSIALFVGIMNYSLTISDRVMLGMLATSTDVGLYNIAFLITNTLTLVFMGFNSSFAPVISELYHDHRHDELRALYSSLTRTILIIVLPAFCWLIGFGDDVLRLFGQEFGVGYSALMVLSVGVVVRCSVGSVGTMLVMCNRQKFNAVNIATVTAMNIGLNWLLIPRYGLLGAAIATTVSMSLIDTVGLIEVHLLLKMHPYRRAFLKVLVAGAVAMAGNLLVRRHTPELSVAGIVAVLAGSYAVFLGVMAALGLERDDRLIIGRALAKLRRHR